MEGSNQSQEAFDKSRVRYVAGRETEYQRNKFNDILAILDARVPHNLLNQVYIDIIDVPPKSSVREDGTIVVEIIRGTAEEIATNIINIINSRDFSSVEPLPVTNVESKVEESEVKVSQESISVESEVTRLREQYGIYIKNPYSINASVFSKNLEKFEQALKQVVAERGPGRLKSSSGFCLEESGGFKRDGKRECFCLDLNGSIEDIYTHLIQNTGRGN